METTLAAHVRSMSTGKSNARKIRKAGRIPAVMYGVAMDATPIEVDPYVLAEMFRKSGNRNTVVRLDLDGAITFALVREVQRHPVTRQLLHIDFIKVDEQHPVTVEVPIRPVGKAKGLALGGRVQVSRRTVTIEAVYTKIPEFIDVDVTQLDIGDRITAAQLTVPEGARLVYTQDFPVITVLGKAKERAEAPAAAAAPAEAAPAKS